MLTGRERINMKKKKRFGDYVVIVLLLSLLGGTFWLYVHNNSKEIPYFYLENNTNRKAVVEVTFYRYENENAKKPYREDTFTYTVMPMQDVKCSAPVSDGEKCVFSWKAVVKTKGFLIGETTGKLYGDDGTGYYIVLTDA